MSVAHQHLADGKATILRHFESLVKLSEEERDLLSLVLAETGNHRAGDELFACDAALDTPKFVVSGWACRAATLPHGRRQILDFYIPGDLAPYSSRTRARAKAAYVCLTNLVPMTAQHHAP